MYRKFTKEERKLIEKENHKAIIYDASKYIHFTDAILKNDYFSKYIDQYCENNYMSLIEICDEIERFDVVAGYFNPNSQIAFNFCGLDIVELYSNHPQDLHGFGEDYDSGFNYIAFISLFLAGLSYNVQIKDKNKKVVFDYEDQSAGYGLCNIAYEEIQELINIYHNAMNDDYFINDINIREYFRVSCRSKEDFFKRINMIKKLSNY